MWHYAHADEKHGPVSEDQLVGMLRGGSLPPSTLVWEEGMSDWQPASGITRLWTPGGGVVQPAPGQPSYQPGPTNTLAITSLVLGIVSFVVGTLFLTAIPGVICGHIARKQIRESPYPQAGSGMAITGLVLNYLCILLSVVVAIVIVWFMVYAMNSMPTPVPAPAPAPPGPVPTVLMSF